MALPRRKDGPPAAPGAGAAPGAPAKRAMRPAAPARYRRKEAEQAARAQSGDARTERNARRAERAATRADRAKGRADRREARTAARAERDARLLARVRRFGQWLFPAHTRRVGRGRSVLILVLNIAPLPGLGTVIYGQWERGLMQFVLTFLFLIGWVWAVFDGFRIVSASWRPPPALRRDPARRAAR